MKKIIFGSFSAILAVIGLSALKTNKISITTYYWFQITPCGVPIGANVIASNIMVSFVLRATTVSVSSSPCNQVPVSQCLVGFTASQIFTTTSGHKVLKTKGVDPGGTSANNQQSKTAPTTAAYVRICS